MVKRPTNSLSGLHDQFAAAALSGGLEQGVRDEFDNHYWHPASVIAKRAYDIADAMLAQRLLRKKQKI